MIMHLNFFGCQQTINRSFVEKKIVWRLLGVCVFSEAAYQFGKSNHCLYLIFHHWLHETGVSIVSSGSKAESVSLRAPRAKKLQSMAKYSNDGFGIRCHSLASGIHSVQQNW
jgi:hypothetical protein